MRLTREQRRVDNALEKYIDNLYEQYQEKEDPAVSASSLGFYQKMIFKIAETHYVLDPRNDSYHASFLAEFTKHYDHFVNSHQGSFHDFFMWQSLGFILIEHCLEPEQIERTIESIQSEMRIIAEGSAEVPLDPEEEIILENMYYNLVAFKDCVIDSEAQSDKLTSSECTLLKRIGASELRDGMNEALIQGRIHKLLFGFFDTHFPEESDTEREGDDVLATFPYEEYKSFCKEVITLISQSDFEFDFLENRYHLCFINAFTEAYKQQVLCQTPDLAEEFFWRELATILISSNEQLDQRHVSKTLDRLDQAIQSFDDPNDYTERQKNFIYRYFSVMQDFENYILMGDVEKRKMSAEIQGIAANENAEEKFLRLDDQRDIETLDEENYILRRQLRPRIH